MSRIGKSPIPVPSGVDITLDGRVVRVKGPQGSLEREIPGDITVRQSEFESAIKTHFGPLKARAPAAPLPDATVPIHKEPLVSVVTDPITSSSLKSVVSMSSLPASIFEKSRMSLITPRSDVPALWILPT